MNANKKLWWKYLSIFCLKLSKFLFEMKIHLCTCQDQFFMYSSCTDPESEALPETSLSTNENPARLKIHESQKSVLAPEYKAQSTKNTHVTKWKVTLRDQRWQGRWTPWRGKVPREIGLTHRYGLLYVYGKLSINPALSKGQKLSSGGPGSNKSQNLNSRKHHNSQ